MEGDAGVENKWEGGSEGFKVESFWDVVNGNIKGMVVVVVKPTKRGEVALSLSPSIPFHQTQVNTGKHQCGHPGRTIENEGGKGNTWDL